MFQRNGDDVAFTRRVGKTIRAARVDVKMTQQDVATKLCTAQSAISETETGTTSVTIWMLRRIAHAMGYRLRIQFVRKDGACYDVAS